MYRKARKRWISMFLSTAVLNYRRITRCHQIWHRNIRDMATNLIRKLTTRRCTVGFIALHRWYQIAPNLYHHSGIRRSLNGRNSFCRCRDICQCIFNISRWLNRMSPFCIILCLRILTRWNDRLSCRWSIGMFPDEFIQPMTDSIGSINDNVRCEPNGYCIGLNGTESPRWSLTKRSIDSKKTSSKSMKVSWCDLFPFNIRDSP